jgi:hypothetical protein
MPEPLPVLQFLFGSFHLFVIFSLRKSIQTSH